MSDYFNKGALEGFDPNITPNIDPSTIPDQRFPSPKVRGHDAPYGTSAIDLSKPENEEEQKAAYQEWFKLKWSDPNRAILRDQYYQTYYGMDSETYQNKRRELAKESYQFSPLKRLKSSFETLSAPGIGAADWILDGSATLVPGFRKIDDKWDDITRFESPQAQMLRDISSIMIPSIITGKVVAGKLAAMPTPVNKLEWIQRGMLATGFYSAENAAVIGLSDQGFNDNLGRSLSEWFPGMFGPKGYAPIPDWYKTLDSDSPSVRKWKNMYDDAGLSFVGTAIGTTIALAGRHKPLGWMIPNDNIAETYKAKEIAKEVDPDLLIKEQQINTILKKGGLSRTREAQLVNELLQIEELKKEVPNAGEAFRRDNVRRRRESDTAAIRKELDPEQLELDYGIDPDVTPGILDESISARPTIPPGNVARNMADIAAIKQGISQGDPAPLISESMITKGLEVGPLSRGAVLGAAEAAREAGNFDAIVDGFRITSKQMKDASWGIYNDIIAAENIDELRQLFLSNRDVKNILNNTVQIEYVNDSTAFAAALALKTLTWRYLGEEITEASARTMFTLGKEVSTIAETMKVMEPFVDYNRMMDLTIDKMGYLANETGLAKYIAGWQLNLKGRWIDGLPVDDVNKAIENINKEFYQAESKIHAKNLVFTQTLKRLKTENPSLMEPLYEAFSITDGDVDSLTKLWKWASEQITPTGLLKSPNPRKMNLFAKGIFSNVMNNVLSGASAPTALVSAQAQLMLEPIQAILGAGTWGAIDGELLDALKRTTYFYGAAWRTTWEAARNGHKMMKKSFNDPAITQQTYRKDFKFQESQEFSILDKLAKEAGKVDNYGFQVQYNMAKSIYRFGNNPNMKWGLSALVWPDYYTNTFQAHLMARVKAAEEVFSEFGFYDMSKMVEAEKRYYKSFWNEDGLLIDKATKATAGEINLNLDDGTSNWINQATTAYPGLKFLFMFPRTQTIGTKVAASWTPLATIPGFNKYSKTIFAKTDEEIASALAEHGIDVATEPNAQAIFKHLRNKYTGRLELSALTVSSLYGYALAGNIRGGLHYDQATRRHQTDELNQQRYTIKIGNRWYYYGMIPGLKQVLGLMADSAMYATELGEPYLENIHRKIMWSLSQAFIDDSPIGALIPIGAILEGNERAFNRFAARVFKTLIPQVGALQVLEKTINGTLKDLEGDFNSYLANRLPLVSNLLPEKINPYTGKPINYISHPITKILNAGQPIASYPVEDDSPEFKEMTELLAGLGWDGITRIRQSSNGKVKWTSVQREQIFKRIGYDGALVRDILKVLKKPAYQKIFNTMKAHTRTNLGLDADTIKLNASLLPPFQELDDIVDKYLKRAESEALESPEFKGVKAQILYQTTADEALKKGNVPKAIELQKQHLEKQELLRYGGSQ